MSPDQSTGQNLTVAGASCWTMDSHCPKGVIESRHGGVGVGGGGIKDVNSGGRQGCSGVGQGDSLCSPTFPRSGCAALTCLVASCTWSSCRASLPLQPWLCCNKTGPLAHLLCLFHFLSVGRAEMHCPPPLPQQPVLERISKPCGNRANDFLEGSWGGLLAVARPHPHPKLRCTLIGPPRQSQCFSEPVPTQVVQVLLERMPDPSQGPLSQAALSVPQCPALARPRGPGIWGLGRRHAPLWSRG